MDTKTALEILNLDAPATLEAAKKAYRDLAKKYHPDVVKKNGLPEWKAEAKMKDINVAFRFLAPLLKSKAQESIKEQEDCSQSVKKSTIRQENEIWNSFLSRVSGFFTNFFSIKTEPSFKKGKEQTSKKTTDKNVHFDDIFRQFQTGDSQQAGKRMKRSRKKKYSQANNSFNSYRTYMALRQKMKSGQLRRHQDINIGKVTRVEPVKPVNPVGKS